MRLLSAAVTAIALSVAACGGSSSPSTSPTSQSPSISPSSIPTSSATSLLPTLEPRDLLGIHFADNETLAREGYLVIPCPSNLQLNQNNPSIPSPPPYVAAGGHEPATAPGMDQVPNPGAFVCPDNGKPLSAWRYYEFPALASGFIPSLNIIHRFEERPYFQIVSWDRVSASSLAGHDVVEVAGAQVLIPTADGFVEFQGQGLSFDEVLNMAASYLGGGPTPIPSAH